ncbi:MAG: hypothetical protein AAB407_02025 [Patescibacteria group bacterium]
MLYSGNEQISAHDILQSIKSKKSAFWETEREQRALELFHAAAKRVPAYKDFLKKNSIQPAKIKTFSDFQSVPIVSKKDYLKEYPLEAVCWDGTLKKPLVFTSTSGSTGDPFYFPRGHELDWEASVAHEIFLSHHLQKNDDSTLVIVGFGMGVWIGGLITYEAFNLASNRKKHPVSILTTGINKKEIFNALKNIAPNFKQVILAGYPPFLKDILDEAENHGINLHKLNIRLLFAAESFPETFRDYVSKKAGIRNPYLDTLNVYGTADIGAMAWETPTAILMRRLAMKKKKLFNELFTPLEKTPTLTQYNPMFVTFEEQNGQVLLTGNNTIPLVRYAVGDHGGVMSYTEAEYAIKENGFDLKKEAGKAGIKDIYELPFVYVYERNDFSTTLYGLQVYPEPIREALLEKPINQFLTGKFTMLTKFSKNHDQYLEINLELKNGKKPTTYLEKATLLRIVATLRAKNSEYRELSDYLKKRAYPRLHFWPNEHPLYFKLGIKQKWVKK